MLAPLLMKKGDDGRNIPDVTFGCSRMFTISRLQKQTAAKV